ncbi:MAG: DUF3606 domain-containing protein [Achromobacter sp.]|uniref:DUF3606 domain-containing protein n=1 Tax=Achromobacter sp. TaxID=134375 RepID=UPI003D01EED4
MPEQTGSADILSLISSVLQVATWLGLPTVTAFAAWLWRDRAAQKKTTQALIDSIAGLGEQLEKAERRDPDSWLKKSREMANRDDAILWLNESVDLTSGALAETFLQLAEHANLVYPGNDPGYLAEAYRLSRLALLLAPERQDVRELVQELEMTTSYLQHKLGSFEPDQRSMLPPERGPILNDQVEEYVKSLLGLAIDRVHAGDKASYEIVTRHARRIGMAVLPVNHDYTLNARQLWAESLWLGGHFERALAEISEIEPAIRAAWGPKDQRVRELALMKGLIQTTLGRTDGLNSVANAASEMGYPIGGGHVRKHIQIPEDLKRAMADGAKTIANQPAEISIDSALELKAWTSALRCSESQLRAAMAAVGRSAPAIRAFLRTRPNA